MSIIVRESQQQAHILYRHFVRLSLPGGCTCSHSRPLHTCRAAMSGSITSVDKLRPNAKGMSLVVKVVDAKVVVDRKGPKGGSKIAECIVGDATGAIVLQARDDQVDVAQPGAYIRLEGAKIDVFRGSMRLVVGKDGKVETVEGEDFRPAVGNNMSLIEFEMVTLPTAGEQPSA